MRYIASLCLVKCPACSNVTPDRLFLHALRPPPLHGSRTSCPLCVRRSSMRRVLFLDCISRSICPTSCLDSINHILRWFPRHSNSIQPSCSFIYHHISPQSTLHISFQKRLTDTLPSSYPTFFWIHHSYHPIKHRARTLRDPI